MLQENPRRGNGTGFSNHRGDDGRSLTKSNPERQQPDDEIRVFMPGIGDEEYQLRAKLRTFRNCAAAMIVRTESDTARALAWHCSDYATAHLFAGVSNDGLVEINRFCHRLMVTAMQAEAIDGGVN